MDKTSNVNFGVAAVDYAKWNAVFPDEAFDRLNELGVLQGRAKVLDIACGSGVGCRALSVRGVDVTGIDPSAALVEEAKKLDITAGVTVQYQVGVAEHLPFSDEAFDGVTVVRAWHWFERSQVIEEIRRVLKTDGWVAVMDAGFKAKESPAATRTMELIRERRDGGGVVAGAKAGAKAFRTGFPVEWFDEWEQAGFTVKDEWALDYTIPFTHEGWRGRVRALSAVVSLPERARMELDESIRGMLCLEFPDEPLIIPHVCNGVLLHV